MGGCLSAGADPHLLETCDGGEEDYHSRFLEDHVLGEGEFGVVKLVHDVTSNKENNHNSSNGNNNKSSSAAAAAAGQPEPLACKVLRKGAVFKDNTLYSPIKPHVLRGEVEMLRALQNCSFCLHLVAIYETPRFLFLVTEFCSGGEMMEYVAAQQQDLTTEDVSRIIYQLLTAVDHCAKHGIIHRDIKPENVMFKTKEPKAELRLIDFGSGTIESVPNPAKEGAQEEAKTFEMSDGTQVKGHTTFAGSAFYISPEMFQRNYTQRTDVWSVGATLYVLVAGYPADELQKAFNILQKGRHRDLRKLPNLPDNMPDSYYELLEACLTYRHRKRPSAHELLQYEFVQFAQQIEEEEDEPVVEGLSLAQVSAAAAATVPPPKEGSKRAETVSLIGSVNRHNLFLGFKKYERSLTTLLAAMLSKKDLATLLVLIKDRLAQEKDDGWDASGDVSSSQKVSSSITTTDSVSGEWQKGTVTLTQHQKLSVLPIRTLKEILRNDLKDEGVLETMAKIPNANLYEGFAYHVALLREFSREPASDENDGMGSAGRRSLSKKDRRSIRRMSSSGNLQALGNANILTNSNLSYSSTASGGRRRGRGGGGGGGGIRRPISVSGGTVFGKKGRSSSFSRQRSNSFSNNSKKNSGTPLFNKSAPFLPPKQPQQQQQAYTEEDESGVDA